VIRSPLLEPRRWAETARRWHPTARYLAETEAHVYALAVSASVLLAFYPFLIVMLSFCTHVLHWPAAVEAIYLALNDFLPGDVGTFVKRNLVLHGRLEYLSLFLLMFTANGIFEPLEVALNRAWGVKANRSYLKNQLVSLGLVFACGGLALLSLMLSAMNRQWLANWAGSYPGLATWLNLLFFKMAALPLSILALFLTYWLLPNRKVPAARVAPVAIVVGLGLEALKYVNLLVWPLLKQKLMREYGVFHNSVTILLWSFLGTLVVLAGAEWTARHDTEDPLS
jgi:uncharacterized BrkB/YihY/UPF0761 family membrane protein